MKTIAGEIAKKRKKPPHEEAESVFEDHRGSAEMQREGVDDEQVANPESLKAHQMLAEALHKMADEFMPNQDMEVDGDIADPEQPPAPKPMEGISETARIALEDKKKKRRYL